MYVFLVIFTWVKPIPGVCLELTSLICNNNMHNTLWMVCKNVMNNYSNLWISDLCSIDYIIVINFNNHYILYRDKWLISF